jgi:hypothetical protein
MPAALLTITPKEHTGIALVFGRGHDADAFRVTPSRFGATASDPRLLLSNQKSSRYGIFKHFPVTLFG